MKAARTFRFLLSFASVCLLGTATVGANEQSAFLTNEGIALLQDGRLDEALRRFRDAVREDPDDEDARYYLAHTQILSGLYEEALTTLDDRKFEFWDVEYLRGIALLNLGRTEAALGHFRTSVQKSNNPRSKFYVGLLLYQRGALEDAQRTFREISDLDEDLEPYRILYLGLIAAAKGQERVAQKFFGRVRDRYPDAPAAEMARELLESGEVAPPAPPSPSRWQVLLSLGEQYDSNPALVQADVTVARIYHPELTRTTRALRTVLAADVGYRLGAERGLGARLALAAYAGFHHANTAATDFNTLQLRTGVTPGYGGGTWRLSVPIAVAWTWLGEQPAWYSTVVDVGFLGAWRLNETWSISGGFAWEPQDYGEENERNGTLVRVPLSARWHRASWVVDLTLVPLERYATATTTSPWPYGGFGLEVGGRWRFARAWQLAGRLQWRRRAYDGVPFVEPGGEARERVDSESTVGLGVQYGGTRALIAAGYQGTFQSSIPSFTYNRHILSLSAALRF